MKWLHQTSDETQCPRGIGDPSSAVQEILVEEGTDPGMHENKFFHPREVVRGLDLDVAERGGRRTVNMDGGTGM